MAYLELSKEAYNDLILAAGMKASRVAKVCELQGVWSEAAAAEEPVVSEPIDGVAAMSDMLVENEARDEPEPDLGTQHIEELLELDADADPLMGTTDD